MPETTPTLSAEQRAQLKAALDREWPMPTLMDDVAETVARMVADAEERGRAEVSAAVEAVLREWERRGERPLDVGPDLRAALTDPAAAVARIKAEAGAEALREFARKWADWTAQGSPQIRGGAAYRAICEAQALESADHIGGDA